MIVYEKNNKLNINFENELDNPDIEIGKGEINVDGNNIVNGGSGGGANVLTLYSNNISTGNKAYKNPECTEQYTSYNEAFNAILNADKIQIVDKKQNGISDYYDVYTAVERISAYMSEYASNVTVVIDGTNGIQHINLWNMEED